MLEPMVTHSREAETLKAKAKWFQLLSLEERMQYLCDVTEMVFDRHPNIARDRHAYSTSGRIQILRNP
jgi:hypothetical protein